MATRKLLSFIPERKPRPKYLVPGHAELGSLTGEELAKLVAEALSELGRLKTLKPAAGPQPSLPTPQFDRAQARTNRETREAILSGEGRIPRAAALVVIGLHGKHRDRIQREFPTVNFQWIDEPTYHRVKVAGFSNPLFVCTHGVDSEVIGWAKNSSSHVHLCVSSSGLSKAIKEYLKR